MVPRSSPWPLNRELLARYEALPHDARARILLTFNGLDSFAEMVAIHDRYTAATRRAAFELDVPLVDMDAIYRESADEDLFSMTDMLHPNQSAYFLEAEVLYDRLVESRLLDSRRSEP